MSLRPKLKQDGKLRCLCMRYSAVTYELMTITWQNAKTFILNVSLVTFLFPGYVEEMEAFCSHFMAFRKLCICCGKEKTRLLHTKVYPDCLVYTYVILPFLFDLFKSFLILTFPRFLEQSGKLVEAHLAH